MRGLKSFIVLYDGEFIRVYEQSAADNVIEDLKQDLEDAKATAYAESVDAGMRCVRVERELRHQKYKRCLAMAKECEATALWCYQAANTLPTGFKATLFGKPVMIETDRLYNRFERLMKWSNRWFKIAKHFK